MQLMLPKPVHQLRLNEWDAFIWEKVNKKSTWIHRAEEGSPKTLWIQLQPLSTDVLKLSLKEVRDADTWLLGQPGTPWPRMCLHVPSHSEGKVRWIRMVHLTSEHPSPATPLALVVLPTPSAEPVPALSQPPARGFSIWLGATWFFYASTCLSV